MRFLFLFDRPSIDNKQADPMQLASLLVAQNPQAEVDVACYDELVYQADMAGSYIRNTCTDRDVKEYDAVYLRRIGESSGEAMTVGAYCLSHDVTMIDEEVARRPGSSSKLTQYFKMSFRGLPFPTTLFSSSHRLLLEEVESCQLPFPVIAKARNGTRGRANHLVPSMSELRRVFEENPDEPFLVQRFIPNTSDYRIWVCGDTIGPILRRKRNSGHANNTSQGGQAELIDDSQLPAPVLRACIEAAQLLDRDIAGADVVFPYDKIGEEFYFFEINRSPQIEGTQYEGLKAEAMADFIVRKATGGYRSRPEIVGCFESVSVKEFGVIDVLAKIDSGAFSGALHCTNIKVFRRGIDKRRVLKFVPLGNPALATETSDFMETYIRSATGHRARRFVINTKLTIKGKDYPITLGISDRSDMKREVLIGRRFLRENNILVDVRINQQYDDEGENTK